MKNLKNLTLVSVMIAAAGLGAQENVGTINGTVRDASGKAVAGALVRISGSQLLQPRETTTDANGRYMIRLILPGQATVVANKEGFVGARKIVTVTAGSNLLVDLDLRSASVQTEEVEIVAQQDPILDKTETKVTATYTAKDLYNLPLGGLTGVYAAMFLAPGVAGDNAYAKVRGGTYGQAMYSINGISMRDPVVGQGRQFEYSIEDLVQDVQVVTNPINAKYGFTNSGTVNVTTKTGTNSFQGSFRAELGNGAWRTYNTQPVRNWLGGEGANTWAGSNNNWASSYSTTYWREGWHTSPPTVSTDTMSKTYFITLSGPIIKDKLTFTYGGRFSPKNYATLTLWNPLASAPENNNLYMPRLLPGLERYKGRPWEQAGNANYTEQEYWAGYTWGRASATPSATWAITGDRLTQLNQYKVFWQVTPNHQLDFNYSKDYLDYFAANVAGNAADPTVPFSQVEDRPMVGLNYRGIYGSNMVVTFTWGRRKADVLFALGPDDPVYITTYGNDIRSMFSLGGTGSGSTQYHSGGGASGREIRDSETASLDANYIWESHNIDFGVQKLNERGTSFGGSMRGRTYTVPGRRWDGAYLVFDVSAPNNPLNTRDFGSEDLSLNNDTPASRRLKLLANDSRVPTLYKYSAGGKEFKPHDAQDLAFYVNDNWTIDDKLALSLGVRFDQTTVNDTMGESVNVLDINPRVRVQYDLFGDNRHVFYGAFTQSVGSMNRSMMGAFANWRMSSTTQTYLWTGNSPNNTTPKPAGTSAVRDLTYFVTQEELKDEKNYEYYYRYSSSLDPYKVDKGTGPEKTTSFDFGYRRAFSSGGFWRVALIYNFLNRALSAEIVDQVVPMDDPSGVPTQVKTDSYARRLYNRPDRIKHYASAEMQWAMPLISKPVWKVNWNGSWTIAKTTGNNIYQSSNASNNAETTNYWWREQAAELGVPMNLYDPYGETGGTQRHKVNSSISWEHGTRGGITQSAVLFANWDTSIPNLSNWGYAIPDDTFKASNLNTASGGTADGMPTSITLYPYGRAHFYNDTATYYMDFQYTFAIPIKGTLSFQCRFMIGNIFNSMMWAQPAWSMTAGNNSWGQRSWINDSARPGTTAMEHDYLWGKLVNQRDYTHWGSVGVNGGNRQWANTFDFGIKF